MRPTHSIGKTEAFRFLTPEQGAAVISSKTSIKVIAPAGSGKTTLMMGYSAARPKSKGLYMAFGKPTQDEANRKLNAMGVDTRAWTTHALAYRAFGAQFNRAGKLSGGMRAAVTAGLLQVNYAQAAAINEMVKNYMCSAEDHISEAHLPDPEQFKLVARQEGIIMDGAKRLWARMVNPADDAPATHDVYLKQWVMTRPVLPFEFILFDEAQDANALTAHLVNMQRHCTRVYVGDPYQAIFGFRGAVNLMDELQAEQTLTLTKSHRFTPNIGLLATTFLKHWRGSTNPIHGTARFTAEELATTNSTAHLARTVAGLLAHGMEQHEKGKRIHWIKGFDEYRTSAIADAYSLFSGTKEGIKDPVLKMMGSWGELKEYVESSGDGEAGPIFRLIEKYKEDTMPMLASLRASQVMNPAEADITLTTGHKAKGLEWDRVQLVNDFFSFKDEKTRSGWSDPSRIDNQEAHLMYVMLTRAKKAIAPTPEMCEWFSTQQETKHLFPKPEAEDAEDLPAQRVA